MKNIKCGFCQQIKPKEGSLSVQEYNYDWVFWCKDCTNNPMARRRNRVLGVHHYSWFYKAPF